MTYCRKGGYIKLKNSIDYTSETYYAISITKNVYLDLDGNTLTVHVATFGYNSMLFDVKGVFVLDSQKGGTINYIYPCTDKSQQEYHECVNVNKDGRFIMNNGCKSDR